MVGVEDRKAGPARHASANAVLRLAKNRDLRKDARWSLNGQRPACGARGFVVRVVEIDPAALRMRYRAGLVLDERQRCTYKSGLTDQSQNDRSKSEPM